MGMNDAPAQQSPTATNSPAGANDDIPANPYLQVSSLCKHYGEGEARVSVLHDVSCGGGAG